jgi:hypothetical protein
MDDTAWSRDGATLESAPPAEGGDLRTEADLPTDELTIGLADDPFADDLDEQLAAREPRRWASRTTMVLAGLVLLVGGFLAGAQTQKHFGVTAAAGSGRGQTAGNAAAFTGGGRQNGGGTATTGTTTTGTVKLVDGTTVYIQTGDGRLITVRTNGSTVVQTVQSGTLSDLTPGAQVSVEGPAASDGTVTATKVSRTR